MGYDLHITRREDWSDDELQITIDEWAAYVSSDSSMRMDGFAEAPLSDGSALRYENDGLAVWVEYSGHGLDGNMAWFDYRNGNISVKNPDSEIRRKMWLIAQALNAKVQGDEGEDYDANGVVKS